MGQSGRAWRVILAASTGQLLGLAVLWGGVLPALLGLAPGILGATVLSYMLVATLVVQSAMAVLFRWSWVAQPLPALPLLQLLGVVLGGAVASVVGYFTCFNKLPGPECRGMGFGILGIGLLGGAATLIGVREWLKRVPAVEERGATTGQGHRPGRWSRTGLRGQLLVLLFTLSAGSVLLVAATTEVAGPREREARRRAAAEAHLQWVEHRLALVDRSRLGAELARLRLPPRVVLALVDERGGTLAAAWPESAPGAPHRVTAPGRARGSLAPWHLSGAGRCRALGAPKLPCRYRPLGPGHPGIVLAGLVLPSPADPGLGNLVALGAFALVLLFFAGVVAHLMGGDAARDMTEVAARIQASGAGPAGGLGEPLRPSTSDEVGQLVLRYGELRRGLLSELDRTERDRARTAEADQAKTRFLEEVSFSLRTPLTAILGYSELLLEEERLTPEQTEDLQILVDSAQHLLGLVRDLMDVSYAEAGALVLRREPGNVGELATREVAAARAARSARGTLAQEAVELRLEVSAEVPSVVMDAKQIRRVLANLLSNALRVTEAGEVVVTVSSTGEGGVAVSVRDTGPGIAPEYQAEIFEQYRQAPQKRYRRQRGSGLGLAIARQIVRLHGGELGLRSTPGEGSDFFFDLPGEGPGERAASGPQRVDAEGRRSPSAGGQRPGSAS